jgi:hypothetical protein
VRQSFQQLNRPRKLNDNTVYMFARLLPKLHRHLPTTRADVRLDNIEKVVAGHPQDFHSLAAIQRQHPHILTTFLSLRSLLLLLLLRQSQRRVWDCSVEGMSLTRTAVKLLASRSLARQAHSVTVSRNTSV